MICITEESEGQRFTNTFFGCDKNFFLAEKELKILSIDKGHFFLSFELFFK